MSTPPVAPDWLSAKAAELWPQVVEQLRRRDRLEQATPQHIGIYCQTLQRYLDTIVQVEDDGRTVETERGSFISAAAKLELELIQRLRLLGKDLGLDEAPLEDEQPEDDEPPHISQPLAELLSRLGGRQN